MNEIAQLLQQRFGLSPDQAAEAERAVLELIKSKLPEQFQGMVGSLLGSGQLAGSEPAETASGSLGSGLLGAAEGMFTNRS